MSAGISGATTISASGVINTTAAGTAALPSLSVGATTRGLYSTAATDLGVALSGVDIAHFRTNTVGAGFISQLGIGTTTPWSNFQVAGLSTSTIALTATSSASGAKHWFIQNGAGIFSIGTTSDLINATTTALQIFSSTGVVLNGATGGDKGSGTLNAVNVFANGVALTSDIRFKKNIQSLNDSSGLALIEALNPVSYNWIDPNMGTENQLGFIAQQVQQIAPELVNTGSDAQHTLSLNYIGLISPAIKAIQQLDARTSFITNTGSTTQSLKVDAAGNVGIGTTTQGTAFSVLGNATVSGTVSAGAFTTNGDVTANNVVALNSLKAASFLAPRSAFDSAVNAVGFASTTAPSAVFTAGGDINLLTLATYNLGSVSALADRLATAETRLDTIESRLAALEAGNASSTASSTPSGGMLSIASSTIINALHSVGVYLMDGIAQFRSLAADRFIAATDSAGNSSAGQGVILAGNTSALVTNAYVVPGSRIFVSFTSTTTSAWYIADKKAGSFRVVLATAPAADTTFDYFIVETDGQIATSTFNGTPIPGGTDANGNSLGGTVSVGNGGTGTTTPGTGTTTPSNAPTITLNGGAAMNILVGGTWSDPGAAATDAVDGDITGSITSSGSVDTATAGIYTISYSVTNSAGVTGTASRVVTVTTPSPVSNGTDSGTGTDSGSGSTGSTGSTDGGAGDTGSGDTGGSTGGDTPAP
jgi:hypothetical protein